jgi:hypothetical protein
LVTNVVALRLNINNIFKYIIFIISVKCWLGFPKLVPTSSHTPAPAAHCHGSKVRIELVSDRGPGANLIFLTPVLTNSPSLAACSDCLGCDASGSNLCEVVNYRGYDAYCTINEGGDFVFGHDSGGLEAAAE